MKHLRYIVIALALTLGLSHPLLAQDSRGRTTSTIIADGLAQLPAQNLDALYQVMSELAATGADGARQLAAMLLPSDQGKNAPFHYAIDGLTSYVTIPGREAQAAAVKQGLQAALDACTDEANRAFLAAQIAKLSPETQAVAHAAENLASVAPASRAVAELRDKVAATPAAKQPALLLKTLKKSTSRELRTTALELGAPSLAPLVAKAFPKLSPDAQLDAVRWLGNRHDAANAAPVISALASSDSTLASAAIEAAGKIGGAEALSALISALDGLHADAAKAALATFNGDIRPAILDALTAQGAGASTTLVALAGERHITDAYQPLTQLLTVESLRPAAATSLAQVVTPDTFTDLLARFQPYPDRYYGLLAQRATADDIATLAAAAPQSPEARAALMGVNSSDAVSPLMTLAAADAAERDNLLTRALTLAQGANWPRIDKYQLYRRALEMQPSAPVANKYLAALATLGNEPALNLAARYMDVPANDLAAAHAVATLVEKNEALQRGDHVRQMLLRAQDVFRSHTEDADAGYAVDQVNTLLPKIVDDPAAATAKVYTLSPEEKAAGYELLFDGTNLDLWHGGTANYLPIDGAIYVSANYGADGNLYTNKRYSDFVLRFEFSFVRPGINNGVGLRTRDGVDAAYDGMEIQILDHDDPIYAGLRDYQVHGSVYGVIPAKRITHKPLGEWNYEEIRAEGDHITVTLNGQVLVDGDIRQACQGHNVAPEGQSSNPYTVDHRDHPGLFNPEGFISFCGHGEGLKLRNIRVLDLSKKKKTATRRRK